MSSWRLALRVARREAWRSRGRSLLVAAMIALPVAGAGAADTLWRSSQISAPEHARRLMGDYDAIIGAVGAGPVEQDPAGFIVVDARTGAGSAGLGQPAQPSAPAASPGDPASKTAKPSAPDPAARAAALQTLLPPGSRLVPLASSDGIGVAATKGIGRVWSELRGIDLTDPLLAGVTRHRSGRAPSAPDEAAITTAEAEALGKGVGDSVEIRFPDGDDQPHTFRITGVYDLPDALDNHGILIRPGALPAVEPARFLAQVPGGVGWDRVKQLNAHGYPVVAKQVLEHPPAEADVPLFQHNRGIQDIGDSAQATRLAIAAIAVSMILLQIVLLAGPAFAVGARRRLRDFGLLGAAGATPRQVRATVLADGVVLGAVGAVLGIAVGLVGSAAAYPWLSGYDTAEPGGFRLAPLDLLAAAGIGLLTGLIAALAPALATARQDVLTALTGRRGQVGAPWRLSAVGFGAVVVGTSLVGYGAFTGQGTQTLPIIGGIAIAELGLVACTPLLVAWSGRLAKRLPLTGRLALRDGARNRGRTAPAVAAIMAAVAGTSAVAVLVSTRDARDRAEYSSELREGQVGFDLGRGVYGRSGLGDGERIATAVAAQLPAKSTAVQYLPVYTADSLEPSLERTAANQCPYTFHSQAEYDAGRAAYEADERCTSHHRFVAHHMSMSPIVAGGPELLRALTGTVDPAAERVLASGGIVVFDKLDLYTAGDRPTVRVTGEPMKAGPVDCGQLTCPATPKASVDLPAALLPPTQQGVSAIVGTHTLDKFGVTFAPTNVIIDTYRMPTADEQDKADTIASGMGVQNPVYVERGYVGGVGMGLVALAAVAMVVTLGAAAVATGLAITDAQADLETLAAVGARPRVRRVLAGSQAAVTAGLGATLGTVFGLLPAVALAEVQARGLGDGIGQDTGSHLTVPWLFLAVVVLVVPALAAGGSALVTRSRIEMRRRRA